MEIATYGPVFQEIRTRTRGEAERVLWQARQRRRWLSRLTMVGWLRAHGTVRAVDEVIARGIPGAFVECGVWRGGMSFLMAKRARQRGEKKTVWMFDSFEGLPPPEAIDGNAAIEWTKNVDSPLYYDNCTASIEEVRASAVALGLGDQVEIVKGWFDETIPQVKDDIGEIAVLRIDGDWYRSVKTCLEELGPRVVPGGIVILDDYDTWEGCALAVHEYLAEGVFPYHISMRFGPSFEVFVKPR